MPLYQADGWLLLPHECAVEIWGPSHQELRRLEQAATLEGSAEFPGLFLNLEEIWAG